VYEPQPGRFPEHPPEPDGELPSGPQRSAALGLGAGGRVRQKIYPDPYGLETWDTESCATVWVHLHRSGPSTDAGRRLPVHAARAAVVRALRRGPWRPPRLVRPRRDRGGRGGDRGRRPSRVRSDPSDRPSPPAASSSLTPAA
jgi:hypothetical protein